MGNYTAELCQVWLCFDCAGRAEGNPHIMAGNLITANTGNRAGFLDFSRERCGYCDTAQGGYRYKFTVWGD